MIEQVSFDECFWLKKAYNEIIYPLNQSAMHHATLISHLAGLGEQLFFYRLIKRILCKAPDHNNPCNKCHDCLLFLANNHPDFIEIQVEPSKKNIGIEQIRKMIFQVYEKSQQGGNKVIFIKNASLMSEAASNALLKTLEEPTENTYFIISNLQNAPLIATIKSRCNHYLLTAPSFNETVQFLSKYANHYNQNELALSVKIANNAPFNALKLLDSDNWNNRKHFYQQLLVAIQNKELWSLKEFFLNQDDNFESINYFCSILTDTTKAKHQLNDFIINYDQKKLIKLLLIFDFEILNKLFELWSETQLFKLNISGINKELIFSDLLLESEIMLGFND